MHGYARRAGARAGSEWSITWKRTSLPAMKSAAGKWRSMQQGPPFQKALSVKARYKAAILGQDGLSTGLKGRDSVWELPPVAGRMNGSGSPEADRRDVKGVRYTHRMVKHPGADAEGADLLAPRKVPVATRIKYVLRDGTCDRWPWRARPTSLNTLRRG